MTRHFLFYAAGGIALVLLLALPSDSRRKPDSSARPEFDRAQFMLMNLNRGKDSSGYYLQESLSKSRAVVQDLDRALHQVEQVGKTYAKSRGRPDDKYLGGAETQIQQARKTAQELAEQLKVAEEELKSSIHQVLLMDDPNGSAR